MQKPVNVGVGVMVGVGVFVGVGVGVEVGVGAGEGKNRATKVSGTSSKRPCVVQEKAIKIVKQAEIKITIQKPFLCFPYLLLMPLILSLL